MESAHHLMHLVKNAHALGASRAAIVPAGQIVVNDALADLCRQPRCPNYGLSKSCPPHVAGPSELRKQLERRTHALFFTIDVPAEVIDAASLSRSAESRAIFRLLHEIAAGMEKAAIEAGFGDAQAYAGGSCKRIFCDDDDACRALKEAGTCRYPQHARPSMSGFGIDVARLFKTCGWEMRWVSPGHGGPPVPMASICGLVLV